MHVSSSENVYLFALLQNVTSSALTFFSRTFLATVGRPRGRIRGNWPSLTSLCESGDQIFFSGGMKDRIKVQAQGNWLCSLSQAFIPPLFYGKTVDSNSSVTGSDYKASCVGVCSRALIIMGKRDSSALLMGSPDIDLPWHERCASSSTEILNQHLLAPSGTSWLLAGRMFLLRPHASTGIVGVVLCHGFYQSIRRAASRCGRV